MIGGKREGAGRKSAWRSPTKMIRLPAQYENKITEYARLLDSDSDSGAATDGKFYSEAELNEAITAVVLTLKPGDRRAANSLFKKFRLRLESSKTLDA
jgi:hypothetical protein